MPYITANNGPNSGKRYDLTEPQMVMGRHPECQIVVDVGAVSRRHAQIVVDSANCFIEDLKSRNGTYLNDQIIDGRRPLSDGDKLRICDVAFTFHSDLGASSKSAPGGTVTATGKETVLIDENQDSGSTIMSKLDVSASKGRVQYTASPQVKLDALLEITQALGRAISLDEVLPTVLESLFKIFVQADRGFIVMKTPEENLVPMWTKFRRQESEDTIRISRTIVKQVMEQKEAILSADATSDSRFEMSQSIADFRIRSMMCAPLMNSDGTSIGVLQIDTLDQRKRFQQEDLEVLASVASQAAIAIDNASLHEDALKQREVERDLELAHDVQRSFLPDEPPQLEGYQFFNYYQAAMFVGGDYFDYIQLPDGRVAVIVADVVGHGIAAALLMAKLAAEARFCLASETNVAVAVKQLNEAITGLNLDRFITMIMSVLNPQTHEVTIANAGHMAPLYYRRKGKIQEAGNDIGGLPLGVISGMEYQTLKLKLQPGESLTMYTDGINECINDSGKQYGIDRVRQQITSVGRGIPDLLGNAVIQDVRAYLGEHPQDDDMCLVTFGRVQLSDTSAG